VGALKEVPHAPELVAVGFSVEGGLTTVQRQERVRVTCPCGFDRTYASERGATVGHRRHGALPPYLPGLYVPATRVSPEDAARQVVTRLQAAARMLAGLDDADLVEVLSGTAAWHQVPDLLAQVRDLAGRVLTHERRAASEDAGGRQGAPATNALPAPPARR